ncbi:MAG: hypothetical protein R3B13_38315 [Polyangiaceae bacterium]
MGLFDALIAGDLTTLRVLSVAPGRFLTEARRDFDQDWDFSGYGTRYALDQVASPRARALGDEAARALFAEHGASGDLARLLEGMQRGGHEMVWLCAHAGLGVRVAHHIHSSVQGMRQPQHALRAGGIRRHDVGADEAHVLGDGLNLSRAMSYKCAHADLPYGGSKTALIAAPIAPTDETRLGFLGYCIDQGHLMTGPDVGLDGELIDALSRHVTPNILCGTSTPLGPTGGPTAEGVFIALRAAAAFVWNSSRLDGKRAVVQGLGSVGLALAERLALANMRVAAYDPDPARVELARKRIPELQLLPERGLLETPCDVLAPCALGGVIDEAVIPKLGCKLIYGAANNTLAGDCIDDEIRLAKALAARKILIQPDWSITVGGVIAGHEERTSAELASVERVHAALSRICGAKTTELLATAAAEGLTPTELAYARLRRKVQR